MKFRKATKEDVPLIVQMIADDELGKLRENYQDPLPEVYYRAFANIDQDPNQELIVIENSEGEIIGTLQLSFIQYLTYQGGIRAQIEAVRIRSDQRGQGIGRDLIQMGYQPSQRKGCTLAPINNRQTTPRCHSVL